MKYLVLVTVFFSTLIWADCGKVLCTDPCSHSKVELSGDKCSVTWNSDKKCFEAYAECGESKKCLGALCYDYCENRYLYFKKGNTCEEYFDPSRLCWAANVSCK